MSEQLSNEFLIKSERHPDGYMHQFDSLLDGFELDSLVYSLRVGSKVIDEKEVRKVVKEILESQLQDMNAILDANIDEIIRLAYKGRADDPYKEVVPVSDPEWEERAKTLASEIYNLLLKYNMWIDTNIYYNGVVMSTSKKNADGTWSFAYNKKPFIETADPRHYFKYVRTPNILSMSFEGDVYEMFNYSRRHASVLEEFSALLKRYGLYYEMGDAWNISCFPVDGE